jgi:hypothetical protein
MPTTFVPRYPVVDPNPSVSKALKHFNLQDYANLAAFCVSGYTFGWWFGVFHIFIP